MQGRKLLRLLLLFLPCENKCQESVAHWFGINNEIPCHCLFAFARALTSLDTTGGLKEESRKKHGTLFFFYFFMRICVSIPVSTCSANNENEEVHHGSILADVVATGDMTTTVKETRREDLPFTRFSHSSPSSSPFVILFFFLFRWGRPRVCVWINNRFFISFFIFFFYFGALALFEFGVIPMMSSRAYTLSDVCAFYACANLLFIQFFCCCHL